MHKRCRVCEEVGVKHSEPVMEAEFISHGYGSLTELKMAAAFVTRPSDWRYTVILPTALFKDTIHPVLLMWAVVLKDFSSLTRSKHDTLSLFVSLATGLAKIPGRAAE